MDEHNTGEGYSDTLHEGYGVVPSNSEYNQSFRSVIASAPPILETETSVYDALSAQNLIQVMFVKLQFASVLIMVPLY
jgi:hypothetical protein